MARKKEKDVEYIVTLDGCRIGKAPTYPEAVKLKNSFSKQYPPSFCFEVSKAGPAHINA